MKRTHDIWTCREETSPLARESSIRPLESLEEMSPTKCPQSGMSKINMLSKCPQTNIPTGDICKLNVPSANGAGSQAGKAENPHQRLTFKCPQQMSPEKKVVGDMGTFNFPKKGHAWECRNGADFKCPQKCPQYNHAGSQPPKYGKARGYSISGFFGKNELNPRKIGGFKCIQTLSYRSMCLGTHTPPVTPGEVSPTLLPTYRTQK